VTTGRFPPPLSIEGDAVAENNYFVREGSRFEAEIATICPLIIQSRHQSRHRRLAFCAQTDIAWLNRASHRPLHQRHSGRSRLARVSLSVMSRSLKKLYHLRGGPIVRKSDVTYWHSAEIPEQQRMSAFGSNRHLATAPKTARVTRLEVGTHFEVRECVTTIADPQ
jgi:hypothetical protein